MQQHGRISTSHGVAQAAQALALLAVNQTAPFQVTVACQLAPSWEPPGGQQPVARSALQTVRGLSRATIARPVRGLQELLCSHQQPAFQSRWV